jgi:hypothetical protein
LRYPAVIVNGRGTGTGLDFRARDAVIDREVAAAGVRSGATP